MLPTVTGAAGGERTGERAGRRPVFLHTVSTSTPSRRAHKHVLPARQAAGECEAVRARRSRSVGRGSVGIVVETMAMTGGEYKGPPILGGRRVSGDNCDEALEDSEEEEEYCWSSESDADVDADEGAATMDATMMETIRVEQRAQHEHTHRQRYRENDAANWPTQRPADYSDGETRSWDRTRAIGSGPRASASSSLQDNILARISTLKALCDQGFISTDEYER
jgi:hypothetical protein